MSEAWGLALGLLFGAGLALFLPGSRPRTPPRRREELLQPVQRQLTEAGWGQIHPMGALVSWLGASGLAGLVVAVVIPIPVLAPLASAVVLGGGPAVVRARMNQRRRRLRRIWPGLIDHVRSAIRSGSGVIDATLALEDRVPVEMGGAFREFRLSVEGGAPADQALQELKNTLADPIGDRVIEALRLAHDVGGSDLPVVLNSLQQSVRADLAVREDARAKQAWIRAASRLGVTAPWLVLVVLSGRAETIEAYQSPVGVAIVLGGAAVSVVAYRVMARLGSLPAEQRWFAPSDSRGSAA